MALSPTPLEVTLLIGDDELEAGTLRTHERRGTQTMTFQYVDSYLRDRRGYELDPVLSLSLGVFSPAVGHELFGVFADSAPDRWGRNLMLRAERRLALAEGRRPRALGPIDFLLGVRDFLRQGAVRLRHPGTGVHLADDDGGVPALVDLPYLLAATDELVGGEGRDEHLKDLLRAGGSLGGARPKAAVTLSDGALGIAKFPDRKNDDWDIALWERVEAELAERSGINVAESRLMKVLDRNVLISKRFDREGAHRIGFMSAMTMLEADDGDERSYVEIANGIELNSSTVEQDLEELFRRLIFSILTNNTDDHLRNHGFLRINEAWQLSPAYDMNPNPDAGEVRTTALHPDGLNASIDSACSVAGIFRLSLPRTRELVRDVEVATSGWREAGRRYGAHRAEVDRMEAAFETEQRAMARKFAETIGS